MKKLVLASFLSACFAWPALLEASSIKECHVVGTLTTVSGPKVTLTVRRAYFAGGHSMGRRCFFAPGSKLTVKLTKIPAGWKKGTRVVLAQRVIINMRPRPRRYVSWSVANSVRVSVVRVKAQPARKDYARISVRMINASDARCRIVHLTVGSSKHSQRITFSPPLHLNARAKDELVARLRLAPNQALTKESVYVRVSATCSYR